MVNKSAGPGVYSATYSNVPVYEYLFGEGLKEHAAGFDKPARTRILEREVQKEEHEKIQGGYGKYQGTWVPLEKGQALAQRNNVYEKLRTVFEYTPGEVSPPPAPKHATNKPKVPKKPAVPKWGAKPVPPPARHVEENYDNISAQLNDDESVADDITVASASYMAEDDRYDMSQPPTGHRKRKRNGERDDFQREEPEDILRQAHIMWADELLDYFMAPPTDMALDRKPEPPINFQPDFIIDTDGHTGLHWAAAIGDVEVMKQLKRFGASLVARNSRRETPLMRAVLFTNGLDKQSFPTVVKELISTVHEVDACGATVLHHAAATTISRQKHHCARYYLDVLLEKINEMFDPDDVQRILDAQDINGNTAVHIAAKNKARKCVRALMGRGASTDILNNESLTAEELIHELNEQRRIERHHQASSSPFAPDSARHISYHDAPEPETSHRGVAHISEAAMSVKNSAEPLLLERLNALAYSFDEELAEKESAEADATRILNGVHMDLASVRLEARQLADTEEDDETVAAAQARLTQLQSRVASLVEQQQQLLLFTRAQHEQGKVNGHLSNEAGGNEEEEKVALVKELGEQVRRRQALAAEYLGALGLAGAAEEGEAYKRLIMKTVGVGDGAAGEEGAGGVGDLLSDENLDSLIEDLEETEKGREGEVLELGEL
ncbi:Ank-repeat mbp1 protein [Rutstroemia sp. NJR-2017a BBW]|nr:Ank-repeat mbp1 protein [Rutstroemia sp. NJR-2017a BBW]